MSTRSSGRGANMCTTKSTLPADQPSPVNTCCVLELELDLTVRPSLE